MRGLPAVPDVGAGFAAVGTLRLILIAQQPTSTFTPTHHAWALGVFVIVVVGLVLAGRRHDKLTRRVFAVVAAGAWLLSSVFYVLPDNLEPDKSLPIQACDLLALFAVITLLLPSRLMRAVMYFGGVGLTSQAFITPTSDIGGPDNIKFWIFWLLHGVILATAIYVVAVDRFYPRLRDLRNAVLFWGVYALAMIALNYGTYAAGLNEGRGWYYGYLGPTLPDIVSGSVLQHFGPWPWRPMVMMLFALSVFAVLWLIWPMGRFVQRKVIRTASLIWARITKLAGGLRTPDE